MIIRRTRFDDFDDWLETVDWKKVKENTGAPMMKLIRLYIRSVGKFSELVGEGAMYLLLAMMGILLYSIITNAMHRPVIWVMEMSQFTMAAYYIFWGGRKQSQTRNTRPHGLCVLTLEAAHEGYCRRLHRVFSAVLPLHNGQGRLGQFGVRARIRPTQPQRLEAADGSHQNYNDRGYGVDVPASRSRAFKGFLQGDRKEVLI